MNIKKYEELYCYFDYTISRIRLKMQVDIGIYLIFILLIYITNIFDFLLSLILIFIVGISNYKMYFKFIKSTNYSFNYLKENKEVMSKEIEELIQVVNDDFILTQNYFIDLSTLNIIKFDDIVSKKYKFGNSFIPNLKKSFGLYARRPGWLSRYCILTDNKGRKFKIILYSFARTYAEDSVVYDIIEERLSNLN